MASGWNLWVWLQCIGVASRYCYKEVYRYPHNNCERSEPHVRVGWRNSLVYIYIYIYIYIYLYPWVDHLVPRGPRVTRNAQTSDRPV